MTHGDLDLEGKMTPNKLGKKDAGEHHKIGVFFRWVCQLRNPPTRVAFPSHTSQRWGGAVGCWYPQQILRCAAPNAAGAGQIKWDKVKCGGPAAGTGQGLIFLRGVLFG